MMKAIGLFFLLLLKIAGWILLVFFLFLCISLLALAFVPVRYTFEGCSRQIPETQGANGGIKAIDGIQLKVKVTWLMHFLCFTFIYGKNGVANELRILGIDIFQLYARLKKRKKRRRHPAKETKDAGTPDELEDGSPVIETQEISTFDKQIKKEADTDRYLSEQADDCLQKPKSQAAKTPQDKLRQEQNAALNNGQEPKQAQKAQKSKRHKQEKSSRRQKTREKKKTVHKAKKQETDSKKTELSQKIQAFRKEVSDIQNRSAASHLWQEICYLLRNYMPRKFQADLAFSCADPALTGGVLGVLSWLPFIYQYPCQIFPDFASTRFYVEGQVMAKGKVTVCFFLRSILHLLRDKDFKRLVRKITGREQQAESKQPAGEE